MNKYYDKLSKKTVSRENGTFGCNKLSTTDWQVDLHCTEKEFVPSIVELRFKNTRKIFAKNPLRLRLKIGDHVMVECPTGNDIGIVSIVSRLVEKQMRNRGINLNDKESFFPIVRYASEKDLEIWEQAKELEYPTLVKAREIAMGLNLQMKFNDVEYQADRKKATFFYTADSRVDFRELIKILAQNFKVKIEMRQIGIRQEAGRVGGLADCGRELCCSEWLTSFNTVPTIAAKQQNLYINPAKLSGQCGRLKCCLNYELDTYLEAMEAFPPEDIVIKTLKGDATVFKIDLLAGLMWFTMNKEYDMQLFPVHVKNVKKMLGINKNGKMVNDLADFEEKSVKKETKATIDEHFSL